MNDATFGHDAAPAVDNAMRIASSYKLEGSYAQMFKQYTRFIDKKRLENVLPAGNKYLTRQGADLFFAEVVALKSTTTTVYAKKFTQALQKAADNCEYVYERLTGHPFVVLSDSVQGSLDCQAIAHIDFTKRGHSTSGKQLSCPHFGLRVHVCTPDEDSKMMQY